MSAFSGANVHTYKNARIETTEWEDVLVKKGIVDERTEVALQRMQDNERATRTEIEAPTADDQLSGMSINDLDEAEDDFDEDILSKIRKKRMQELRALAAKECFGEVLPLVKADFIREVTEASRKCWVVCEMYQTSVESSVLMSKLLRELATRHKATKFVRIVASKCVENWPDSRLPALMIYHDGECKQQLIGLGHVGGLKTLTVKALERSLGRIGAVDVEHEEEQTSEGDFRMTRGAAAVATRRGIGGDDDDW